jgi:hypothetical protein
VAEVFEHAARDVAVARSCGADQACAIAGRHCARDLRIGGAGEGTNQRCAVVVLGVERSPTVGETSRFSLKPLENPGKRILGSAPGKYIMSDDFDGPLS